MSSNKGIKKKMIQRYGAIDFLDRLHIKIPKTKKYKSKGQLKRMKQLTYHHIVKTSEGGETTIGNGALLTAEHHQWFHQQMEEVQIELNSIFQELKRKINNSEEVKVEITDEELFLPFKIKTMTFSIDEKGKIIIHSNQEKDKEDR